MRITLLPAQIITMAVFAVFTLNGCEEASIPLLSRDASLTYDLTSPYEFKDVTASNTTSFLSVNPVGISIKSAKEHSDGSIYITLGGTSVNNGIPDALHEIYYPADNSDPQKNYRQTDYAMGDFGSATIPPLPIPAVTGRPLENSIALKSVSKNSKYTAVTVTGMVTAGEFIQIREENESLRLLSSFYIDGYNAPSAMFNPNRKPMYKEVVYYKNPNFFSENGFTPSVFKIFRGRQSQLGGFNVLIWDGASPKQATFNVSYDNGKTFKKTIIDWSQVRFAETPLVKLEWQNAPLSPHDVVNPSYQPLTIAGVSPNYTATATVSQYPEGEAYPPASSIAEGGQPIFTPSNATDRNFYHTETDYSGVYRGTYAQIELADRVRVSAIQGAGAGQDDIEFKLALGRYPDGTPITEISLKVIAIVSP